VAGATATATALVERLGYAAVEALVADALANATTVRDLVIERKLLTADEYAACISPENVMKLGSRKI
jgi:aspartate ammonia-lyase